MTNVFKILVALLLVAGVYVGVKQLRLQSAEAEATATATPAEPPAGQLAADVERMKAQAALEHPGLTASEALKQTAATQAGKHLEAQSPEARAQVAAEMFFGYYFLNTRVRVAYCRARQVDLGPFVKAFDREHAAELARARAIFAAQGTDPETLVPVMHETFLPVVEQDMKDIAASVEAPLDRACVLFNDNAATLAKSIALPPPVRDALMAAK
jgi:hypothetical protein